MDHIGIDLGSKESQVCIRSAEGEIRQEFRCATRALGEVLAKQASGRVVLETCTEAFRVAGLAVRHGHEVRVGRCCMNADCARTGPSCARQRRSELRRHATLSRASI